jgi:hypothetical protein
MPALSSFIGTGCIASSMLLALSGVSSATFSPAAFFIVAGMRT